MNRPEDASQRQQARPVVCYEVDAVPRRDPQWLQQWHDSLRVVDTIMVPARDAATFRVPAGHGFRIISVEGPQVGDLNLWNANDLTERFFSGKTRQLHATHVTRGDRLWSSLPGLRPMASITHDTLEWYGWDSDGGGVHDVIGTRCDPYTNRLLKGVDYHHCCHSNLTRAMASELKRSTRDVELLVHDVLNVFMCTGFTRDTHQYFMKASPVRPGDYIEFLADIDLLGALSACPGGDCGSSHSDDSTPCYPLRVDIVQPSAAISDSFNPEPINAYDRSHGLQR
jgi:uncharacterized protein YcgI (DUF1989 family)